MATNQPITDKPLNGARMTMAELERLGSDTRPDAGTEKFLKAFESALSRFLFSARYEGAQYEDDAENLVQIRDLFLSLEANAILLSQFCNQTINGVDIDSCCLAMAREARRGITLFGEVLD